MKVLITKVLKFFRLISLAWRLSKRSSIRGKNSVKVSTEIEENEIIDHEQGGN